jgi:hypothetical protein
VALLEKRRFLYNHSGDFPQVILIVPSHVPNTSVLILHISNMFQDEDALERASGKRILVYPFDR